MPQRIAALSSEVSSSGKISTLSGCLFSSSSVTLASSILAPVILSAFAGKSVPAVLLSEIKQMKAKNGNECASLSTERLVFLYCVSQICLRSMTIYTKQSKTEWMPFVKYLVSLFDAAQGLTYMIRVILFGISCIVLRMSDSMHGLLRYLARPRRISSPPTRVEAILEIPPNSSGQKFSMNTVSYRGPYHCWY